MCKIKGHTRENCWKIIGYPNDFKFRMRMGTNESANKMCNVGEENAGHGHSQLVHLSHTQANCSNPIVNSGMIGSNSQTSPYVFTNEQYTQILQLLNKEYKYRYSAHAACQMVESIGSTNMDQWIIDMDATNHMVTDISVLNESSITSNYTLKRIHLPNGDLYLVIHVGSTNIFGMIHLQMCFICPGLNLIYYKSLNLQRSYNALYLFILIFVCFRISTMER